jgi:hypothetical protein
MQFFHCLALVGIVKDVEIDSVDTVDESALSFITSPQNSPLPRRIQNIHIHSLAEYVIRNVFVFLYASLFHTG